MKNAFSRALGDPKEFLERIPELSRKFSEISGVESYELDDVRKFVQCKNFEITDDENTFKAVVAAFAVLLIDWYAQKLRLRGFFEKRLVVESRGFKCDFLDLFYRCVFEGVDLAPKGEGLPTRR